jgi:hypothetical protein
VSWSETFLAIIAVATLTMALVQLGTVVAILRLVRQVQQTMVEVHREARPLIAKMTAVTDEVGRTAAMATVQAQKVDRLLTDLAQRVDQTAGIVQHAIITPAREGLAIMAALKAGLGALRGLRERHRQGRTAEEEDPLFIG